MTLMRWPRWLLGRRRTTGRMARRRAPTGAQRRAAGVSPRAERVERLGEAARVGPLGLGERLEPLGDVVEAFLPRGLRHARVQRLALVRLAGVGGLGVLLGAADGHAPRRVTRLLEVLQVAVRVAGLAVRRLLEEAGD